MDSNRLSPCREWIAAFLIGRNPESKVHVLPNTERTRLRHSLSRAGLAAHFPESTAWEMKVDVAAIVQSTKSVRLVLVELKAKEITLPNVGQLLGYCRVCRPVSAFLLSPRGLSTGLRRLLVSFGRTDILFYDDRSIQVGSWDTARGCPDWGSLLPRGIVPRQEK
jgi:hypothetical protein